MTSDALWRKAQDAELRFHLNDSYRAQERLQRAFYSGMLELSSISPDADIVDLGCGPQSLLLDAPQSTTAVRVAVDPLRFTDHDESRYRNYGIMRRYEPAEKFDAVDYRFDEAWLYNVLQHVIDPELVLGNATRVARTIRIFEWTEQPLTIVHLHSPSKDGIVSQLRGHGFKPYRETTGRSALVGSWDQSFYAGVWKR